jgi:uncharacterized membrane protein
MSILIIFFGVLIFMAGVTLIANSETIFKVLRNNSQKLWLHIGAVVVRLLLGALLIYQASVSKFPLLIEVIGWIAIIAAIVFAFIGRNKFQRLISWAFTLLKPLGRFAGVLAISFGIFLIYSFI